MINKYDAELDLDTENSLSLIVKQLREYSEVLEFGPATGRLTKYMQESLGCQVDIVEVDPSGFDCAVNYARDGLLGDIERMEWEQAFAGRTYDFIIFADVLEHLRNPQAVLAAVKKYLKEDGRILLSVPNVAHNSVIYNLLCNEFQYNETGLLDETHVHLFTYHSLRRMVRDCGYHIAGEQATYIKEVSGEFPYSLDDADAMQQYQLEEHEYGHVYQFIFALSLQENPHKNSEIETYEKTRCVNIYYRSEKEEYCEEKSLYFHYARFSCNTIELEISFGEERSIQAERHKYTLILPTDTTEIRIDPVNLYMSTLEMHVRTESGRSIPFKTDGIRIAEGEIIARKNVHFFLEVMSDHRYHVSISPEFSVFSHAQVERIAQENNELQESLRQKDAEIAALTTQKQLILHSTSWKITKPYRWLAGMLKKAAGQFLSRRVKKGLSIILHEGFASFFKRWNAYRKRKKAEKFFLRRIVSLPKEIFQEQQRKHFEKDICFSIIVPLYNTPKDYLMEMIESCKKQTYKNWELCLADGSDLEHGYVGEMVQDIAKKDSRIKYQHLDENGGISENTNAALRIAQGDYIALLDHDDLLHPAALYEYMEVICSENADFIYCDEMTFEGKLDNIITMHFKPDFAVDNLRANNYICHFSVFSRELLDKAGMFRKEYDGSQDHDMILRLTEQAKRIIHIPKILYFWRSHPASVASDISSKTYAIDAGKRAVLSHLERCGLKGSVESSWAFPTIFNVKYELQDHPKISIIIPNKDHVELLSACIESILGKSTYDNYEILVIENNSVEDATFCYYEKLQKNSKVKVIIYEEQGFNYAGINNFGVTQAGGEYVLFLNNDIEIITPEWMEEMLMYAQRKDVGAVGAKLYYPDHTVQHAGIVLGLWVDRCAGNTHQYVRYDNPGYMGRLCYAQECTAVTAACLLVSKEIFTMAGGFDEQFAVAYNDVDLCMAIRKNGYLNVWTPCAEAYHYESVSRGYEDTPEKMQRFQREAQLFRGKWQEQIEKGDPYYNVNFSLDSSDFSIRTDGKI